MAEIHGFCDDRFSKLSEMLSQSIDSGDDLGASVALTIEGKPVIDIWGGWADPEKTKPWEENTITNVWSTTKTMMTLSLLVCVDRGLVDVNAPVATYWPEFAANGKEGVLVRHILSHNSGVSGWEQPCVVEDIYDWEASTAKLAAQAPWWEPGTGSGYHALNQGHLVGEVIRRVTGRKLGQFFAEEIAGPFKIDFQIGTGPKDFDRISNVVPPPPLQFDLANLDMNSVLVKTFTGPAPGAEASWTPEWRQADIGAANGHGNARSVARAQSILACEGELEGVRLLSKETCQIPLFEQSHNPDQVLGLPVRFGIGYALPNESVPHLPQDARICFWGGWGGSAIIVDLDRHITFSYVMNRMAEGLVGDERSYRLIRSVYETLGA